MQINLGDIILALGSAILGAIISVIIGKIQEKTKFVKELKNNNDLILSASDWHAAWQTSVDGQELLNTEHLVIEQKGATLKMWNLEKSPENPKGGYLWEGQLRFYHGRDIMGWYFPKKSENNASKGIMFLNYNSSQKMFIGKWVGAAYDSPLCNGFVVISKERTRSLTILKKIIKNHPNEISIISQVL